MEPARASSKLAEAGFSQSSEGRNDDVLTLVVATGKEPAHGEDRPSLGPRESGGGAGPGGRRGDHAERWCGDAVVPNETVDLASHEIRVHPDLVVLAEPLRLLPDFRIGYPKWKLQLVHTLPAERPDGWRDGVPQDDGKAAVVGVYQVKRQGSADDPVEAERRCDLPHPYGAVAMRGAEDHIVQTNERGHVRCQLEHHALATAWHELIGRVQDYRSLGDDGALGESGEIGLAQFLQISVRWGKRRVCRSSSQPPHLATNRVRFISDMLWSCSFRFDVVLLSMCTTRARGFTITFPQWVHNFRQRSTSS